MAKIRFWDGVILFDSGKIAMDVACCCAEGCGYDCAPTPPKISITFAGLSACNPNCVVHHTDGSKSYKWILDPNATYVLDQCGAGAGGDACRWVKETVVVNSVTLYSDESDCTGASTTEDGSVWVYAEYLGAGDWGVEMYLEFVADYADLAFSNLAEDLGAGCKPDGDAMGSDIYSGSAGYECGDAGGSVGYCSVPANAGQVVFDQGTATLTAVF